MSFKIIDSKQQQSFQGETFRLAVVLLGASGDLAKKKIYPSLFNLYKDGSIQLDKTVIWGFGRSDLTHYQLRQRLIPYLVSKEDENNENDDLDQFLSICFYQQGNGYDDVNAFHRIQQSLVTYSGVLSNGHHSKSVPTLINQLFYFAIPPNLFLKAASTIHQVFFPTNLKNNSQHKPPWRRVLFEKPFGRDLQSYYGLSSGLSQIFDESEMYRIDHYLGKHIVRQIQPLRFNESTYSKNVWDRQYISHVIISLKEPFGTDGRGGYFDSYGIIRDVMQNHLLQVLTLIAMENPSQENGAEIEERVRSAKVNVLNHIQAPLYPDDCVLGQYEGYADDPSIRNKATTAPTFAAIRLHVNTSRWKGVPFILVAGKAMDERIAEVQVVFHDRQSSSSNRKSVSRNLVFNIQPDQCIFMKTSTAENQAVEKNSNNINHTMVSMKTNRTKNIIHRWEHEDNAYKNLIMDSLLGNRSSFVRDDELRKSWEILTPLLNQIENVKPKQYKKGSCGPENEIALKFPELTHSTEKTSHQILQSKL